MKRTTWAVVLSVVGFAAVAGAQQQQQPQTVRPRVPEPGGFVPPRPTAPRPGPAGRLLPGAYLDPILVPVYGYAYDPYAYAYDSPVNYTYGASPDASYGSPYPVPFGSPYPPPAYGPVIGVPYSNPSVGFVVVTGLSTAPYAYSYSGGGLTVIGTGRLPITMIPGGALQVNLENGVAAVVQPCPAIASHGGTTGLALAAPVLPPPDSLGRLQPYQFTGPPGRNAPAAGALGGGAACWGLEDGGSAVIVWP